METETKRSRPWEDERLVADVAAMTNSTPEEVRNFMRFGSVLNQEVKPATPQEPSQ